MADCLVHKGISDLAIKVHEWETLKLLPIPEKDKNYPLLSNSEMTTFRQMSAIAEANLNRRVMPFVNGQQVYGSTYELIEYAKALSKLLGIQIDFTSNIILNRLIFNYYSRFGRMHPRNFFEYFMEDKIDDDEVFPIERKRYVFATYFCNDIPASVHEDISRHFLN